MSQIGLKSGRSGSVHSRWVCVSLIISRRFESDYRERSKIVTLIGNSVEFEIGSLQL